MNLNREDKANALRVRGGAGQGGAFTAQTRPREYVHKAPNRYDGYSQPSVWPIAEGWARRSNTYRP